MLLLMKNFDDSLLPLLFWCNYFFRSKKEYEWPLL